MMERKQIIILCKIPKDPIADIVRVLTVFKRKWTYHFWTVFFQSVILIGVAYMTFYFKISNFQVKRILT